MLPKNETANTGASVFARSAGMLLDLIEIRMTSDSDDSHSQAASNSFQRVVPIRSSSLFQTASHARHEAEHRGRELN
jgi:hypothetical protein